MLVGLKYFDTGMSYRTLGELFNISAIQVSRTIRRVVSCFEGQLSNEIIFPEGDRVSSVKRGFFEIAAFPNVIGCVDGSLIPIKKPTEHEHIYVSRKHYHAINLMVICDHNLLFTHVNARFPGSAPMYFACRTFFFQVR